MERLEEARLERELRERIGPRKIAVSNVKNGKTQANRQSAGGAPEISEFGSMPSNASLKPFRPFQFQSVYSMDVQQQTLP